MNLKASSMIVLIFILGCSQSEKASPVDELLPAINQFNEAFSSADTTILSTMLTENYMHTNGSSGPWGKSGWLSYVAGQRQKLDAGNLKIDEYTMSDLKYNTYGNAAIVSAIITNTGTEDSIKFSKSFKVTHLWVYEDGSWKRAGFHDGKIN